MTAQEPRRRPGETAVLRYITRDGKPGMSWPTRVVEDRDDLLALFVPAGTRFRRWDAAGPRRQLVEAEWRRDTLRLMYPGEAHSIWLSWEDHDVDRRFLGYYVNMEEPFRRSEVGFDTNDHMLDIVVAPDLGWEWKDDDVMAERVRSGVYSGEFADAVRSEGERVIADIEHGRSPFSREWEEWRPPPGSPPRMPPDWATAPVTLWPRRVWAYGEIARG